MYAPGGHRRADRHAHADLARRAPARTGGALCAGMSSAGAAGAAGLRAAGRTGSFPPSAPRRARDSRSAATSIDTTSATALGGRASLLLVAGRRSGCAREARALRARRWDAVIGGRSRRQREAMRERDVAAPALELRDVRKSFGADRDHPRRRASTLPRGERHAIIGPNGAGKTTLFNLISGRFPITSGTIALERPAHRRPGAAARSTGSACRAASRSPRSSRA